MSRPAVIVENLSKQYARIPVTTGGGAAAARESFFALREVSFEVKKGESLGIIGKNGSGKSTLLKILSGITKPSAGQVCLSGRAVSILDVGSGFHPDLSGRDNVFLRGQLLGMSRAEVQQVFDEIVAFSGIEKFIDSPVKHYSSGMYLRLAFSVMVHVRADVLLLDEVMSVGDAEFQLLCRSKMEEMKTKGTSILLVSHQLKDVEHTNQTIQLDEGRIRRQGNPAEVTAAYYTESASRAEEAQAADGGIYVSEFSDEDNNVLAGYVQLRDIRLLLNDALPATPLSTDDEPEVAIRYKPLSPDARPQFAITCSDLSGNILFETFSFQSVVSGFEPSYQQGECEVRARFPRGFFNHRPVTIGLVVAHEQQRSLFLKQRLLKFAPLRPPNTNPLLQLTRGHVQVRLAWRNL